MYKVRLQELCREAHFPVAEFGSEHFVVTPGIAGDLRILPYVEQWKKALSSGWYHVRMADHSIFIFSEGAKPSYAFLHSPLQIVTFAEYLEALGERDTPRARALHREDYAHVFDTASLREYVTPIRFDYDAASYRAGARPAAHIHIGLDNEIRLAANKMSAVSFLLFVMRQMYPKCWERLLGRQKRDWLVRPIRGESTELPKELWSQVDRIELHLA
ncbi:DUF2290 domain-containing protein [Dokdonella sp.]|uniref:DUF2290 domain-containing protein n=1 Tax=Dokdonella sp. TaxID=2291710 RepID=UPI00378482A7